MRILLLGATGPLGRHTLREALRRGHRVRVLVRDPSRLPPGTAGVEVLQGDATDVAAMRGAMAGMDAVVSALGPGPSWSKKRTSFVTRDATRAMLEAAASTRLRRFVGVSALGVGRTWDDLPRALRPMYRVLLRQPLQDKLDAERLLEASGVDWVLVYPPILTDDAGTGDFVAGARLALRGMAKVARGDVARLMLDLAESGSPHGPRVEVASTAGQGRRRR